MNNPMRVVSLLIFLSIVITISICPCNGNLISVPCKEYERQALLMLKQDLKDPSNRLSSWVGGEGDCCNWTGVICDKKTGHVRELHLGNYYSDEEFSSESSSLGGNLLVGNIPSKIGDMRWLESLDFSRNKLTGQISPSMSKLTFLSNLNLSYNYLTGQIPESTQLQSLDRSSFFGNKLCGPPLEKCSTTHGESSISSGDQKNGGIGRLLEDGWLDLSLGLGFAFGFWSVLGSLLLNMPWSTGFSQFQNNIVSKLYAIIQEKL